MIGCCVGCAIVQQSLAIIDTNQYQRSRQGNDGFNGEQPAIMDEEAVSFGQNVQVVDPDVRAYVYSLVTAVSTCANGLVLLGFDD